MKTFACLRRANSEESSGFCTLGFVITQLNFLCLCLLCFSLLPQAAPADSGWFGPYGLYILEDDDFDPLLNSAGLMITLLEPEKVGCLDCPTFDMSPLMGLTYRRWLGEKGLSVEFTLAHCKNSLAGGVIPGTSESMLRALPVSVRVLLNSPIKRSMFFYDRQMYIGAGIVSCRADLDARGADVHFRISESLDGHEFVAGIAFVDDYREKMYRLECKFLSLMGEIPLGPGHVAAGGQAALDAVPPDRRLVMFDLSGLALTVSLNHVF